MPTRRLLLASLAALPVSGLGSMGWAATAIVFSSDGTAINGYDPVAYFTEGGPVRGRTEYRIMWKRAIWQFASWRNLEAFEANPRRYAPRYGGYCAYAVSRGYTTGTDPAAWTIYEGRLYLNLNRAVQALWRRDIPGNIARADANWPGVLNA